MIEKTQNCFEDLSKHRARLALMLDDSALRGVKTSVVEKYSNQAHFIYELLQNADDAEATEVRWIYKFSINFSLIFVRLKSYNLKNRGLRVFLL